MARVTPGSLLQASWRTFSDPPQDWPLALCDARSVGADEGTRNTLHIVDQIPDEQTMLRDMPDEDSLIAAAIFHYNPKHRWWYFSNMTRDEVVLLKFHDSDRSRAMRVPHTAFCDPTFANAKPRHSIECRSFAFFELIRPATVADIPALARLVEQYWKFEQIAGFSALTSKRVWWS